MNEFLKYAIKEKYRLLAGTNDPQTRKEIARLWRRLRNTR